MALKALADRSNGILQVKCPHCEETNSFPGWSEMFIFICDHCGEPVEVEEPVHVGEEKTDLIFCGCMSDSPMSKEELEQHRRGLSMLSEYSVQKAYREAYEQCRMDGDRLPGARAIHELVTVWKQLWKWRR